MQIASTQPARTERTALQRLKVAVRARRMGFSWVPLAAAVATTLVGLFELSVGLTAGAVFSGSTGPTLGLGFILLSIALTLVSARDIGRVRRWLVYLSAGLVFVASVVALGGYLHATLDPSVPARGTAAARVVFLSAELVPMVALLNALIAAGLLLLTMRNPSRVTTWVSVGIGAFLAAFAVLVIMASGYDAALGNYRWKFLGIPTHAALAFLLLSVGAGTVHVRRVQWTWTVSSRTTRYFAAGILSLIFVCAATSRALNAFADTSARVSRTLQIQAEIGHLQRSILEAVTARRNFAVERQPWQLTAIREAAQRALDHLASLAEFTKDDAQQQVAVQQLRNQLSAPLIRATESDAALLSAAAAQPPPRAFARADAGTDILLGALSRISDQEQAKLRGREEQARNDFAVAQFVVPTGAIASVLLLTAALLMLNGEASERKRAEASLQQLNVELDTRVQQRTVELEDAVKELESFSYSVSHDLRAPLRHIQGYATMLERVIQGQVPDKAQRYFKIITGSCGEMGRLIDDLLEFSRMGRAEMGHSRVRLDEVVGQTLHALEMSTSGRNIRWKIAPLPPVVGDASMLRRVFDNLVGNAVKYSRTRDPAEIEIGCNDDPDGRAVVYVRDNGAGFDMQYVHKLFGVFQRLHRADEFEGTGIGLAIVRRVISRHGGRAWAEGALGQGATFYVTLQRAAAATNS
jgi:signal transduction histidine kinase